MNENGYSRGYERSYDSQSESTRSSRKFSISSLVEQMQKSDEERNHQEQVENEPYMEETQKEVTIEKESAQEENDMQNAEGDYEPMYPIEEIIPQIPSHEDEHDEIREDSQLENYGLYEVEDRMTEFQLLEELSLLAHEKIPERMIGAKGMGAYGKFTSCADMSAYTMADFLSRKDKETPAFVRFAPMFQSRAGADTARDMRLFEIKLDTDTGVYDIFAVNMPVFFIRNGEKFASLVNAMAPSKKNGIRSTYELMTLAAKTPEMTQALLRFYSNEGTQKSYVNMKGYTPNTYVWINADGDIHYVRYIIEPHEGGENISSEEAELLAGIAPDTAMNELYNLMEQGKTVEYDVYAQLLSPENAQELDFNPLDATRTWRGVAKTPIGTLSLNKNVEDYIDEVEKALFSPANTVNGISLSEDELLKVIAFFISDMDKNRLGSEYHRTLKGNKSGITYNNQYIMSTEYDDFSEAGDFYESLTPLEKEQMIYNIAKDMRGLPVQISERLIEFFTNANDTLGESINIAVDASKKQ